MPKIKNKHYKEFIDGGFIKYVDPDALDKILDAIPTKFKREGRACVIAHYLSGARPSEILQLRAHTNIYKEEKYAYIVIDKPTKRGLPRKIPFYLNGRGKSLKVAHYAKELLEYSNSLYPDMLLFPTLTGDYTRQRMKKNGDIVTYVERGYKLRYHFYKWSTAAFKEGLPIYFLRHNRFSSLAESGAALEQIRILKGSRTMAGVTPYSHLSQKEMRKMARMIK